MLRPLLLFSAYFLLSICNQTTTEDYWDDDAFDEEAAVNKSRPSEQIADSILKDYRRSVTPPSDGEYSFNFLDDRPIPGPVEVYFDISGLMLARVQSSQRSITAVLCVIMRWKDPRLGWRPSEHSNITEISLPDDAVWIPPFVFFNAVKFKFTQYEKARLVRIYHDGWAYYVAETSITSYCWMGVSFFPFDVEECLLLASSPLLCSDEVVARVGRILVTITMARHSLYYVIVLIVPTALLSFIATAGFFGTSSPECITNIGFSSLLTMSMLLSILSGIVPKSSELPLLGEKNEEQFVISYYITVTLVLICVGAFLSIIVAIIEKNVESDEYEKPPPRWIMKLCCVKEESEEDEKTISFEISTSEDFDELNLWIMRFIRSAHIAANRLGEELRNEQNVESWRLVFRRSRLVLLLIFEIIHLSILAVLLSYWGKNNISPMRRSAALMFFVNYLNRNFTDVLFPLYEGIYTVELIVQLLFIFMSVPAICAIWNTKYFHRNIRLRLVFLGLNAIGAALARIVIIYHQVFGPNHHVEVWYLIVSSVFREYFKVYITLLALMLAFDRGIATHAWLWYESRALSTIFILIAQEIVASSIALCAAYLLINETITDQDIMIIYFVQLAVGLAAYQFILRYNRQQIEILKRGAQIESYSVSRSFQLRENLAVMKMLSQVSVPAAILAIPCFLLYGIYSRLPPKQGYDILRYLSIAFYDVWISLAFLSILINLVRFDPRFRHSFLSLRVVARIRQKLGIGSVVEKVEHARKNDDTKTYFTMLANDWN